MSLKIICYLQDIYICLLKLFAICRISSKQPTEIPINHLILIKEIKEKYGYILDNNHIRQLNDKNIKDNTTANENILKNYK